MSGCYVQTFDSEYPYRNEPPAKPEFRIFWYPNYGYFYYPYPYNPPYYWAPKPKPAPRPQYNRPRRGR